MYSSLPASGGDCCIRAEFRDKEKKTRASVRYSYIPKEGMKNKTDLSIGSRGLAPGFICSVAVESFPTEPRRAGQAERAKHAVLAHHACEPCLMSAWLESVADSDPLMFNLVQFTVGLIYLLAPVFVRLWFRV